MQRYGPLPRIVRHGTRASSAASTSLRKLMRAVAQPIAIITLASSSSLSPLPSTTHNHGATVSSLTSISLDPALVAFSIKLPSKLGAALTLAGSATAGNVRVHLLAAGQEPLARAFARQPTRTVDPLDGPTLTVVAERYPPALFEELGRTSLGILECTLIKSMHLPTLVNECTSPLLSGSSSKGIQDEDEGGKQQGEEGSELFIVKVERVIMNEQVLQSEGSLVYWDHGYRVVGAKGSTGE